MKLRFALLFALILAVSQGWATNDKDVSLINQLAIQFSSHVGEQVSKTVNIQFADAEIPPDPNSPVIMSNGNGNSLQPFTNQDYSVSIDGGDSTMFTAVITTQSFSSNACTVKVTYAPTEEGTHQATLTVYCNTACVPAVSVTLTGTSSDNLVLKCDDLELSSWEPCPDYLSETDIEKRGGAAIVKFILDLIKEYMPEMHFYANDESGSFNNVTVGTSATKTFQVWGNKLVSFIEIFYLAEDLLIENNPLTKLNNRIIEQFGIPIRKGNLSIKIKIRLTPLSVESSTHSNLDGLIESPMFSIDRDVLSPAIIDVDQGGKQETLTVTYKPTTAGTHSFRFDVMFDFFFNGVELPDWLTIFPIENISGLIEHTGTAIDPTPSITVDPASWDFGTVELGQKPPKTFTVTGTNLTGNISLKTSNTRFKVTPTSLPASGGTITVTYEPTAIGNHSATLTISCGDVEKTVDLSGKCVEPPSITVNPTYWDFGTVELGQKPPKTFSVTGTNLTGNITLKTSNTSFKVTPTSLPASGGTVTVTYEPTAVGNHTGILTISCGNIEKTVNLSGKCVAVPSLTVTPKELTMNPVYEGQQGTAIVTIKGENLSAPITLVEPWTETLDGNEFSISPKTLPKTGGKVTVTYTPSGAHTSGAQFKYKSGDQIVSFCVTAKGVAVPRITVNPATLDFGTVAKNSNNTKEFTVRGYNLTGNLKVSPEKSSYFTVSPTTITAAQAQSANGAKVTVTYKPEARGSHSATFTISGGGATSKTVSVSGKCAEITATPSSLKFSSNYSQKITVKGYNLTGKLTLSSDNSVFTVSPSSITASQAASGVEVTVKCNAATNLQHTTGKITISGGSAASKTVSLSYDKTGAEPQAPAVQPDGEDEGGNEEFTNGGSLEFSGNTTTDVNELAMDSKIYAEGQNIIIESPAEQSAMISDIAGHVWSVDLQARRNEVPICASGVYIVRIREKTTKLMIK